MPARPSRGPWLSYPPIEPSERPCASGMPEFSMLSVSRLRAGRLGFAWARRGAHSGSPREPTARGDGVNSLLRSTAITAGAWDRPAGEEMVTRRTGLLIIRAWVEDGSAERLRAQIRGDR